VESESPALVTEELRTRHRRRRRTWSWLLMRVFDLTINCRLYTGSNPGSTGHAPLPPAIGTTLPTGR